MGWERRGGRWYLYRNRRVSGRPVKEYVAARGPLGLGDALADALDEQVRHDAQARQQEREERARARARSAALLTATADANEQLRAAAHGLLEAVGFHRHNRGGWRMRRQLRELKDQLSNLQERVARRNPLIEFRAPAGEGPAADLFAQARTGDPAARAAVAALIRERGWAGWLGDLGQQATRQLIRTAAGDDPVWEAGITEHVLALRARLLGDSPTVLDELLVRRVLNGWVATHALELELTLRPPAQARDREHLDRALTRAQKRLTEAVRELARVRQLKLPTVFAQLNVAAVQAVVSGPGGAAPVPAPDLANPTRPLSDGSNPEAQ